MTEEAFDDIEDLQNLIAEKLDEIGLRLSAPVSFATMNGMKLVSLQAVWEDISKAALDSSEGDQVADDDTDQKFMEIMAQDTLSEMEQERLRAIETANDLPRTTRRMGRMTLPDKIEAMIPEEIRLEQMRSLQYVGGIIFQPKYDGHRVLIDYRESKPKILNRKGELYGAGPFKLDVPYHFKSYVIDGEYLHKHSRYIAFDLLWDPFIGDLTKSFVTDRVKMLDGLIGSRGHPGFRKCPTRFTIPDDVLNEWKSESLLDGLIAKRMYSTYTFGRNSDWKKCKFVSDLDAVVTKLNIDSKSNCELSLRDPVSGTWFEVGKASTLGKMIKKGDVVQVRFLKFTGSRLREPRIIEVRTDKTPDECSIVQLADFV